MQKSHVVVFILLLFSLCIQARSHWRKKDPNAPHIILHWEKSHRSVKHTSEYYQERFFNISNSKHIREHILPSDILIFDNNTNNVSTALLNSYIEELLFEIRKKKKKYKHFDIITTKNFNRRKRCGLLILKFKNYPFVLKLFIETPKTFIDLYSKGFENQFFFYMAGGINRHVAGLTRIKNREIINQHIAQHPQWKNRVSTPRKWFWLPKKARWIHIDGKNIGEKKTISTKIPGTYAIIADAINTSDDTTLSLQEKNKRIMQLCTDLHLFVDPHENNFVFKFDKKINDYRITIVDTEHFPSMVGLEEEPNFTNHFEWYMYLASKAFQDMFLQTKYDRRNAHKRPKPLELPW